MKTLATSVLATCFLVLGACGDMAQDEPEDVDVPPAAERVSLEGLEGSAVTGELAVTPQENDTHIVLEVNNAPTDESLEVRLHSGTCDNPGPELADLGTIRADDTGYGNVESTVNHAPGLIMDGNHVVVVWASLDDGDNGILDMDADRDERTDDTRVEDDRTTTGDQTGLTRDDEQAIACSTLPMR